MKSGDRLLMTIRNRTNFSLSLYFSFFIICVFCLAAYFDKGNLARVNINLLKDYVARM